MKLSAGQAGKICLEAAHQLGRIALLLFMLVLTALGLFAFTLSRHPIELPHLASWLATRASGDGISVHVEKAELAWAGYQEGGTVPLVLRVSDIEVHSAAGVLLVTIPRGDMIVPPADIFGGQTPILMRASAARLSGSEAPVTVRAKLSPGPGYTLAHGTFLVSIGAGVLGKTGAHVPVSAVNFTLNAAPGAVDISDGVAVLKPIGASAPVAHFSFTARRAEGWTATLHATLDAVRAGDLGQYWPPPALTVTRDWVVSHITAGVAQNADFTFSLKAPGDLSALALTDAVGGFDGEGLTLYWLPDYLPITGLNGHFAMPDEDEAIITASAGQVQNVAVTSGRMDITGMSDKDQTGVLTMALAASVPDLLTVLNTAPLSLLKNAPALLGGATGQVEGGFTALIPFQKKLTFDDVKLAVTADIHDLRLPELLPPLGAEKGEIALQTDGHGLQLQGKGLFAGEPATVALNESFTGAGKIDLTLTGAAGEKIWHWLHLDAATALNSPAAGTAPFTLRLTGTATGAQTAVLNADLTPAAVALPVFGWAKAPGAPGAFALTAQLQNGAFVAARNFTAHAPALAIEGIEQGNGLTFSTVDIGRIQASGRITWPSAPGEGWFGDFSGPVLDIRQTRHQPGARAVTSAPPSPATTAAVLTTPPPRNGPSWTVRLSFARLYLAPAPAPPLGNLTLSASGQGAALVRAEGAADGLDVSVKPQDDGGSAVALHAEDTGTLLRAMDQYQHLEGGALTLAAHYGTNEPLHGQAKLLEARFSDAPGLTKLLEGLTLYGLANAASGPGLKITDAEIPFTLEDDVLQLRGARAFTSSLGFTATGSVDLGNDLCDIEATVVPLYAVNALPGKIPLIGRLFAPEKGGGLIAMRAHIHGPFDHPQVTMNPLSALTPGFLRSIFGLGSGTKPPPGTTPPPAVGP
jgi:hypothetical protein